MCRELTGIAASLSGVGTFSSKAASVSISSSSHCTSMGTSIPVTDNVVLVSALIDSTACPFAALCL